MADIEQADLTTLTVDLLSAYLSNNTVDSPDLAGLIQSTHMALSGINAPAPEEPPAPEFQPAVTVRKSLGSRDHILSLIDGKPYKTLKRHLSTHGLTPAEYRTRYKLPVDYPIVAPSYSEHRRAVAERLGLGRKPAKTPPPAAVEADESAMPVADTASTAAPAKATSRSAAPKVKTSVPKSAPVKAAKPAPKRVAKAASPVNAIAEAAPVGDPSPTPAMPPVAKVSAKAPPAAKLSTPKAATAKAPKPLDAIKPKAKAAAVPKPATAKGTTVAKAKPAAGAKPAKVSKAK